MKSTYPEIFKTIKLLIQKKKQEESSVDLDPDMEASDDFSRKGR